MRKKLDKRVLALFLVLASLFYFGSRAGVLAEGLYNTIYSSSWSPPSPDTSGITYNPSTGQLIVVDSEVNEMPIFENVNVFTMTLSGNVTDTSVTTSFSNEPTDIALNPSNGHLFITDDDQQKVFEVDLGMDGTLNTADDVVTSFDTTAFGSNDPEGITYGDGKLFIVSGADKKLFTIDPGNNGIFDGVAPQGDDQVNSFSTSVLKMNDPEGVAYNSDTGTLYIVSYNYKSRAVEATQNGQLVRNISISSLGAKAPSGIEYAPSSFDPNRRSLYITDRGVDNNKQPSENDGRVYEFALDVIVNPTPTPTPTPTPPPSGELALDAIADSFVDGSSPNTNHATATALYVDGSPEKITYLKFDTSALSGQTASSVVLRIQTTTGSWSGSPDTQEVKLVIDSSWTETGITYSNKPASSNILGSIGNTASNTVYDIVLDTNVINQNLGGLLSVDLEPLGSDAFYFNSRETSTPPQLIINY